MKWVVTTTAGLWLRVRQWRPRSRRARIWLIVAATLIVLPILLRVLPKQPLSEVAPSSRIVLSANGKLLRLTLAADGQYRLWTPLNEISRPMQQAIILYEDRWFYEHPGFNPWALVRAGFATLFGSRRIGGSTITMQLARRVYDIDSRTIGGKLEQTAAAVWLELRYSKRDILEAYLNYAPFGSNIEGIGAASLVYLGKPAKLLTVPEALNLAVIPQNPRKRLRLDANGLQSKALRKARRRLARSWAARHKADARYASDEALQMSFSGRSALPFRAPHLVEYLLQQSSDRVIHSTIELPIQNVVERILHEYVKSRASDGITNASALLIDASTMQVKALVGSADYFNDAIAGQVDGAFAKRSPGSTLKPFIYALALDQGLIHSGSILKDSPRSFGAYSPEDFDGRFTGPITAQDALIRSRNVPAVALASHLSQPDLYEFLQMAGVQDMFPESHYGLALVLGGGEVTMVELAQLYAVLANHGEWQALQFVKKSGKTQPKTLTLLSKAASFITLDMLRHAPRPDTYAPAHPAIAWKTGTSWAFRDAWTAGVFGRYVLVVWVGNFDGSGNPAFVGIHAAAPLFLRIVDALREEHLDPGAIPFTLPADLMRVEVCTASGDIPNKACHVRSKAWFIAGKSPIRKSTLDRAVLIDTRTGKLACTPSRYTRMEIFEYWPSDMVALFKQAGMPLRQPPAGSCDKNVDTEGAPSIVTPLRGVIHMQRLNHNTPLYLRAEAGANSTTLMWFVDNALVGSSKPGESLTWYPPQPGTYLIRVVDEHGNSDTRRIRLQLTN